MILKDVYFWEVKIFLIQVFRQTYIFGKLRP